MTTGVETAASSAPPAPPATRQRLWSRWVAGGALVVMAAASTALLTERATYQPLVSGSGGRNAGLIRDGNVAPGITPTVQNVLGLEWRVENPMVGEGIYLDFPINNVGDYGVKILSIGPMPLGTPPLEPPRVYMSGALGGSGEPWLPFKPFTLKPGGNRDLRLVETVLACPAGEQPYRSPGSGGIVEQIPVTYGFMGATHTTSVVMPGYALSIFGLPLCEPLSP